MFHVGADEDEAAGAELAFFGGFQVAESQDAVDDLLLFLLQGGQHAKAERLDREPEPHYGKAAWMAVRSGHPNERTERGAEVQKINQGYAAERERGRGWIRQYQQEIERLVRQAAERVRNLGRNLGRDFGFER